MRRWLRRLFALLVLGGLLALLALMRAPTERLTDDDGARVYVLDGDSLRIGNRTIRLEGIDAVELHQLCRAADGVQWSCGVEARGALGALVAKGGLVCESRAADRFNRALSHCASGTTPDLAAELVEEGWAVSDNGRAFGPFIDEQDEARAARRGIWRGSFDRPADWRAAHPRSDP